MILRYDVTMDDILAFNRFHYANSKTIRGQKIRIIVFFALVCLLASGFGFITQPNPVVGAIAVALTLAVTFVIFAFVFHATFHSGLERQVRNLFAEGNNDGMLGFHELAIDEDGISEKTDVGESRRVWTAVNRIDETDDYAFVYISALAAHVIPKHNITSGDATEFIQRARELLSAAKC